MKTHFKFNGQTTRIFLRLAVATASLVTIASSTTWSHPGHGVDKEHPWSALHFLGSIEHAVLVVVGLAVVGIIGSKLIKCRHK